ncbi:hypothetical protein [Pseudoalteromonas sp. G4]|uniref:hypothetical protein n=1 Tax=Pseudoalteromonas sp. G4 TaxID=2992761 RepID=UPI00237DCC99|nr:hypothetical protein [Pseudoalteromonas sp. G4]MDE3271398.1 hypothetical protein [Pseudoalteromonas sp. G4]
MPNSIDWSVVGNGPILSSDLLQASYTIGFNQLLRRPFNMVVHNYKERGQSKRIGVQGDQYSEQLLPHFIDTANFLQDEIGCWPSLGLVVLTTGVKLQKKIAVQRMDLLPSLARPVDLENNMPLAASYHNWLAERRYAFKLLNELDWPQLELVLHRDPVLPVKYKRNCLRELIELSSLKKTQARDCINWLCKLPLEIWIESIKHANIADIIACDNVFMLSRSSRLTKNWWLYDSEYSIKIDQIRTLLAQAQAYCYAKRALFC